MTWVLTTLTAEDRDLVLACLRADADRREKVAKDSSLQLVRQGEEGRALPVKAQRGVRELYTEAETLRALAWELEHQAEVSAFVPALEVVEEERAATYPPPQLVPVAPPWSPDYGPNVEARVTKSPRRKVKVVEFRDDADERAAAMAAHPSNHNPNQED